MRKSSRTKLSFLVVFIAGLFLLIFLEWSGVLAPRLARLVPDALSAASVKNIFVTFTLPFQRASAFLADKAYDVSQTMAELKHLKEERDVLAVANAGLEATISHYREVERENEALRRQLGFESEPERILAEARVIGRDPLVFGRSILIDKGGRDGLEEGMPVIAPGNTLIGRITEVLERSAKVRLLYDIASKVPALAQDSRLDGLVKGDGTSSLTMDFISKEKELKTGETIITSGLGNSYPKGLLIGTVEEVFSSDNQFFQKAKIASPVNYQHIEEVFVILAKEQ